MLNTYLAQFDPELLDRQDAFDEAQRAQAERAADYTLSSPERVQAELDSGDTSDLYDKTLWVRVFGKQMGVADAAMLAACLPAEQAAVVLADVRREVREFLIRRELEG